VNLLRARTREAVRSGDVEELVAKEPRAVRYLLGLTYHQNEELRKAAARGVAIAARYHPKLVENVVRRLIWAMNDESGTNAVTAPEVLEAIAREQPELLLPVVPDLTRLAADLGLHDGLAKTLHIVADRCPGKVGERLGESLNRRFR
jgi:hypothetical protein